MALHTIINQLADDIPETVEGIKDGNIGAMETYAKLTTLERLIKEAKAEVLDYAIDERELLGKEDVVRYGYRVSVVSTQRFTYQDAYIERYKALIKARETLCKKSYSLSNEGQYMYDENGEVIPPAISKHTVTIKCEKLPEDYHDKI